VSQFPITISTPVTLSIILNGSQLDAGSQIQAERNDKALRRIQKKMMRARSTLDWSQSNNISCSTMVLNCSFFVPKYALQETTFFKELRKQDDSELVEPKAVDDVYDAQDEQQPAATKTRIAAVSAAAADNDVSTTMSLQSCML